MRRLMLYAAFPIVLSGCVLVNQAKLNSEDESVWRPALEELAKEPPSFMHQEQFKNCGIKFNEDSSFNVYRVADDTACRNEVRKAAIDLLMKRKEYAALMKLYSRETYELYWTDAKGYTQSEKRDNPEVQNAIATAFATDEGILTLFKAVCRENKIGDSDILKKIPDGEKRAFLLGFKYCSENPGKDELALNCYRRIDNPTSEMAKIVLWNEKLTVESEDGLLDKVLDRITEKELRDYLPKIREQNPEKYWRIWARCATNEEALKIWNSNADDKKKMYALGRITDDKVLADVVEKMKKGLPDRQEDRKRKFLYGEAGASYEEKAIRACFGSLRSAEMLSHYAQDEGLWSELRACAFKSLVKRVCDKPSTEGTRQLTAVLSTFDYTSNFGELFENAQEEAMERGCKEIVESLRKSVEVRVKEIIADGKSVEDEVIGYMGFRPGMYNWEFDLLWAYTIPQSRGNVYRYSVDEDGYIRSIQFRKNFIKQICGDIDISKEPLVKDAMSTKFGEGLESCWYEIESDEKTGIVINVNSRNGIPRFKNRKPNKQEEKLLRAEWIRKDGEGKGYIDDFYAGKENPEKGSVYVSGGWGGAKGIVMAVCKDGIVVGRKPIVDKTETKTIEKESSGHFLDKPKLVEKVQVKTNVTEFPVKLFLKMKGDFSVGQKCPEGKFRCIGTVKAGNDVLPAFELYSAPKK